MSCKYWISVCIPTEAQKELNKNEIDEEVVEKVR